MVQRRMCLKIFTVFSLCLSLSYSLRIDRCNIGIKSRLVKQVVLPSNCTEGTLYWSYPQGTLIVDLADKGRFTFCIDHVSDRFVRRARITTAEDSKVFQLPKKRGESRCFKISDGGSLELFGPKRRKTFMAFIPYKILRTEKVDIDAELKVDPRVCCLDQKTGQLSDQKPEKHADQKTDKRSNQKAKKQNAEKPSWLSSLTKYFE